MPKKKASSKAGLGWAAEEVTMEVGEEIVPVRVLLRIQPTLCHTGRNSQKYGWAHNRQPGALQRALEPSWFRFVWLCPPAGDILPLEHVRGWNSIKTGSRLS